MGGFWEDAHIPCMCFHVQLWWTAIGRDQAAINAGFDFRRYAMKPVCAELLPLSPSPGRNFRLSTHLGHEPCTIDAIGHAGR
jgi:hypothetical protein